MADILVNGPVIQSTSQACIIDVTPPTFAGIVGLTSNSDGSLTANWSAASDVSLPISYEVYIQKNTATGLFSMNNLALIVRSTSARIFALSDATPLENSTTYYVGVRAVDAVGNADNNTISLDEISEGVRVGEILYGCHGIFSINAANQLQATLWATENGLSTTNLLGNANYTVYDAAGIAISGMTQSGISADVNGRFHITPISAAALLDLTHYSVKIGIVVDGVERVAYKGFTLLGG